MGVGFIVELLLKMLNLGAIISATLGELREMAVKFRGRFSHAPINDQGGCAAFGLSLNELPLLVLRITTTVCYTVLWHSVLRLSECLAGEPIMMPRSWLVVVFRQQTTFAPPSPTVYLSNVVANCQPFHRHRYITYQSRRFRVQKQVTTTPAPAIRGFLPKLDAYSLNSTTRS